MENEIRTESYTYCRTYPIACQHLENDRFCKLYIVKLITGEATDMDTGREDYFVERCEQCKKEN